MFSGYSWVLPVIVSYLYGSIPFSYIIPKWLKNKDVTKYGDGNIGAMNAYYTTKSKMIALLCFLLDFSKGFIPTYFFGYYGIFGIIGHQFSIFSAILLKKPFSGLGMAATIGFLILASPILIVLGFLFYIFFLFIFYPKNPLKWQEVEQGNIETVCGISLALTVYLIFFKPPHELEICLLILMVGTLIAYSRRISEQIRKCFKV